MEKNLKKRILTSIVLFLFLFFAFINNFVLGYLLMIISVFSVLEFFKMMKIFLKNNIALQLLSNLIFIFYIFCFSTIILTFSFSLSTKTLFFLILLICIASDIGGFVFGKTFKGPKLTKISPNKTYAGMIGGYFLTLLVLIIITNFIDYPEISMQLFLISILISTISQVGDIIVSYFKRLSKIKDTGKILPGHGGLLDRIDGMIFAFPIYYLFSLTNYLNT